MSFSAHKPPADAQFLSAAVRSRCFDGAAIRATPPRSTFLVGISALNLAAKVLFHRFRQTSMVQWYRHGDIRHVRQPVGMASPDFGRAAHAWGPTSALPPPPRLESTVPDDSLAPTAAEIEARLVRDGVRTVLFAGADSHGVMRGKRVPVQQAGRFLEAGVPMSEEFWVIHVDESGFVDLPRGYRGYFPASSNGYPDILAVPDLSTYRVMPWHGATAILLCDWQLSTSGGMVPISPRHVLNRVIARTREMGYEPCSALELEFYLLRESVGRQIRKRPDELVPLHSVASTYGALLGSLQEGIGAVIREHMLGYGLPVEACNPESGPGQFEMTLRYGQTLSAADDAFLFKNGVKEVAAQADLLATFMAKPNTEWPGNSCHIHVSLRDQAGRGSFYEAGSPMDLSMTARHFVGGVLGTMREFTAIMAPTPNSYRRLMPHYWAGNTATWGADNRSTGVRVISAGEHGTRVEHRQPGADCNPYLAAAASLAAGMHGIANRVEPPDPMTGNVYNRPYDAATALPSNLGDALDQLESSAVARDWLGGDFVDHFVTIKRAELTAQSMAVTDWEVSRYLSVI